MSMNMFTILGMLTKKSKMSQFICMSVFVESTHSQYIKFWLCTLNVNSIYLLNQGLTLIRVMFNFF